MHEDIAGVCSEGFSEFLALHRKVSSLHECFRRPYPIAMAENQSLYVFEYQPTRQSYQMVAESPRPLPKPIPNRVRAAVRLDFYGNQPAAIVTKDVFSTKDEMVSIFHEFVHCYQMHTCEPDLRNKVDLARKKDAEGDYMWELDYPFPYNYREFIRYARMILETHDSLLDDIREVRSRLRESLGNEAYEYLVWQEWKEGFARYIENKVRRFLTLNENHGGNCEPYSRVTLYETGSILIAKTVNRNQELANDLQQLFWILAK